MENSLYFMTLKKDFPYPQNETEAEKGIQQFLTHRIFCGELELSNDFKAANRIF